MRQKDHEAARREHDHQRWADDGGFVPDFPPAQAVGPSPWFAVGIALGLGFALGWVTGRRSA